MKKLMIVLLGSLLCINVIAQNTVYVTNTVYVQQPIVYPGQNVGQSPTVIVQQPAPTVVYQPAPTVIYQPAPVYVGPSVIVSPFGYRPYYHPYHYYGPSVHVGIGFGGYRRWR